MTPGKPLSVVFLNFPLDSANHLPLGWHKIVVLPEVIKLMQTDLYTRFNRAEKYHFSLFQLFLGFLKSCHLTCLYLQVLTSFPVMFLNLGLWMSFSHNGKMKRLTDVSFAILLCVWHIFFEKKSLFLF